MCQPMGMPEKRPASIAISWLATSNWQKRQTTEDLVGDLLEDLLDSGKDSGQQL